ncbi:hypothetical protein DWF00_15775 [Bosea caraganae]|uniref:DUF2946 domain-containing protein n=1 Tax=Bosea caraganae TaxID=2763117 RepID=A0A370L6Z7_9HYPH|nr:hypothetical protein [Bosea caraganae]RDJ25372.1 hypothetical protein DWE98_11610 [Bosea caraganae]RDJ25843.1 hypothetical protein DWF00_15775 [Bosea caraganae]
MTHGQPPSRKLPAPHRRHRALLAALAIMLVAVLPHVTFAASMLHGISQPLAVAAMKLHAPAGHGLASAHSASAPCHEQASAGDEHAQPTKPPCCIIGCGLIGLGPEIAMPRVLALSHRLGPPPPWSGEGAEIEPAERPPRSS